MNLISQRIRAVVGKAIAQGLGAEIWWMGLEPNQKEFVFRLILRKIDDAKPEWLPRRLWNYLHKDIIK